MSALWAKPGVKCVYNGSIEHTNKSIICLERGRVYTIRDIIQHPTRSVLGCYLEEVVNERNEFWGLERGYRLDNFRPLITKTQEQDVQMILSMLAPDRVSA